MSSLTVTAENPAYGGLSIGRISGKVIMIHGAIPGETVDISIVEEKKDYSIGSVQAIRIASPDRIPPRCELFGLCGGCQLQYITSERQTALKEEVLRDSLKRNAGTEIALSPAITDLSWGYRYRGQFKISPGKVGFYREKSRDVIDTDHCPLMTEGINQSLREIRELILGNLQTGGTESLKEIHVSWGDSATAFLRPRPGTRPEGLAQLLLDAGFSGVWTEQDNGKIRKLGRPYTALDLEDLQYTVSPISFFQGHWKLNQKVVRTVKETLGDLTGARLLDLYSGAGNFSLPLAAQAAEIVAVEENPFAVEDGKRNLRLNNITNYRFIHSEAEALRTKDRFDLMIVDPPRSGLTRSAMDTVLSLLPERIVYIACNPSTLARDIKKLLPKYEMESVRLIDFFPQTYHIESLAFLRVR
ncbi:MAG: class I SAM-dependent RNA methyltransferase [Nitrospirales bacterium]|nr:class I SAM-dependent RNA methyltransferase [Nitrospirales bacterium]